MRYLALVLLVLTGCASPAPRFFGAVRHDISLEGYRFAVFVKDDRAEVIRLGYLRRAERDPVPALMWRAAEMASGCAVQGPARGGWASPSLPGDTGEARFQLACDAAPAAVCDTPPHGRHGVSDPDQCRRGDFLLHKA